MTTAPTISVAEFAEMTGNSRSAIYEGVRRGDIENVGYGRAVRIPRRWVNEYLAGRTTAAAPTVAHIELIDAGTFT